MKYDLHVHTSFSDGKYDPKDVVRQAIEKGLSGLAITDHDTVSGIHLAIEEGKEHNNFYIIPGIEFSCIYKDEEVHILGYFIDYNNSFLLDTVIQLQNSRYERALRIINKLKEIGITLDLDSILQHTSDNNVGRLHIAKALVEKNVVKNTQEAFNKYLGRGKQAYFERFHLSVNEVIDLIKNTGGISVLAHPGLLKDKSIIHHAITCGIDGIECIHSKHNLHEIIIYKTIARENKLLITGGSDYHGEPNILGNYYVGFDSIAAMKERYINV